MAWVPAFAGMTLWMWQGHGRGIRPGAYSNEAWVGGLPSKTHSLLPLHPAFGHLLPDGEKARHHTAALGGRCCPGVDMEISNSASFMSAPISANSGVER